MERQRRKSVPELDDFKMDKSADEGCLYVVDLIRSAMVLYKFVVFLRLGHM